MTIVYILAAILIFGVLIAVHELGHISWPPSSRRAGSTSFPSAWGL